MKYKAVLTEAADTQASQHLLRYFQRNESQEALCFALWQPSTGQASQSALIDEIILPQEGEQDLHGNVSFHPNYLARAIQLARKKKMGLAFMHSHPFDGWQGMSITDVKAERDILALPAGVTGLPLVGLTIGTDGYWSARFWLRDNKRIERFWCDSVRVLGAKACRVYYNDNLVRPAPRREILKRTFDSWGHKAQNNISRLKFGIVGLGSVGCIVAETLARIGASQAVLIDADKVELHNLDRLLYGTTEDIGRYKVDLAKHAMQRHATAEDIQITALRLSIRHKLAYHSALDCDVIFSCVDRPVARDVLNFIANAHLIPVIDGGVAVEANVKRDEISAAHWRAHIISPYHQCMRCNQQYNTSMVQTELDGSLDDPSYIASLPEEQRQANQNVFPFSLSIAAMEVNLMLHYFIAPKWYPRIAQQEYQFITGETKITKGQCLAHCPFRQRRARGDAEIPHYLFDGEVLPTDMKKQKLRDIFGCWWQWITSLFSIKSSSDS